MKFQFVSCGLYDLAEGKTQSNLTVDSNIAYVHSIYFSCYYCVYYTSISKPEKTRFLWKWGHMVPLGNNMMSFIYNRKEVLSSTAVKASSLEFLI